MLVTALCNSAAGFTPFFASCDAILPISDIPGDKRYALASNLIESINSLLDILGWLASCSCASFSSRIAKSDNNFAPIAVSPAYTSHSAASVIFSWVNFTSGNKTGIFPLSRYGNNFSYSLKFYDAQDPDYPVDTER